LEKGRPRHILFRGKLVRTITIGKKREMPHQGLGDLRKLESLPGTLREDREPAQAPEE